MRSEHGEQASLPIHVEPACAPPPRRTATPVDGALRHRLEDDALASLGWPAGTELLLDPSRRPRRGEVVLAMDGVRRRVGIFEVQLGRAALRTDHGSVWIGRTDRVLGVVRVASAPLPVVAGETGNTGDTGPVRR
ncbi:hypothetical protein [Nocardioides sp. AE5]|uniref:hypothetical protein n=1 Tax=Nocardioides sp. AE5 TaxID=2962573 RepID=UPI002882C7CE|nr:hypothetical protein [Nocardioides sp. AE5]MDT0201677.1 hypothetical protein [Nocardioides sp. AE5]